MFIRWLMFIFIGLPTQLLVYLLYPFLFLFWKVFVEEKHGPQLIAAHEKIDSSKGIKTRNNNLFLDNKDTHGAFTMYGFISQSGLYELIDYEGNFIRRITGTTLNCINQEEVSGDVVVSWAFASLFTTIKPEYIKKVINNYIKYLGTRSYDTINKGDVSNRCNNFGINYCPDSSILKLGQPMLGPQFYTTSSLLALGYNLGPKYKLLFWLHWIILGGWYWALAPVLFVKSRPLYYVRDITMKALYIHLLVFGPKWWIIKPMKFIYGLGKYRNDLFAAMLGKEVSNNLPECMDAFFSQKEDCTSRNSNTLSSYVPIAIKIIEEKSKKIFIK